MRGIQSSVSTPYYNFFLVLFGLPLLFLTGVGPLIAWRRASPGSLYRTFRWPVVSAIAGRRAAGGRRAGSSTGRPDGSLAVRVRDRHHRLGVRPRGVRPAGDGGRLVAAALLELVRRNRRRYGGYIVHLAMVLLVVGIVASGAYSTVGRATWRSARACSAGRLHS